MGAAFLLEPAGRPARRRGRVRRVYPFVRHRNKRPAIPPMVGRKMKAGFTLIELLVVLAIIATLLTIAVPRYYASLDRSKEAVLKENLYQMRDAIGKYYADKGKYPESLDALATDQYLRKLPLDPITDRSEEHTSELQSQSNLV